MNQPKKLLECTDLDFSYPGSGRTLLRDLSLELAQGEILTLLGPSGCGKTTLLKLLSGFIKSDAGELRYHDQPLDSPFPEGQMIFQDSAQLLPWLSVEDNILFPVQTDSFSWNRTGRREDNSAGIPPGERPKGRAARRQRKEAQRTRLNEILKAVGLTEFSHYHPARLSGGMKQRCALGRALMAEPEILFLDEPFGSLDAPSRAELQSLLLSLWEKTGFSMIFVTHDIAEALYLSDRIILFTSEGPETRNVDLSRPRNRQDRGFRDLELELYSELSDAGRTL